MSRIAERRGGVLVAWLGCEDKKIIVESFDTPRGGWRQTETSAAVGTGMGMAENEEGRMAGRPSEEAIGGGDAQPMATRTALTDGRLRCAQRPGHAHS